MYEHILHKHAHVHSESITSFDKRQSFGLQRLLTVVGAGGATVAAFTLTDVKFHCCSAALPAVRCFDPETAHRLTIAAARYGLLPADLRKDSPRLAVHLWGRVFTNPLGIAAGFDKDAEAIEPVLNMGLGFMEVGALLVHPQHSCPLTQQPAA